MPTSLRGERLRQLSLAQGRRQGKLVSSFPPFFRETGPFPVFSQGQREEMVFSSHFPVNSWGIQLQRRFWGGWGGEFPGEAVLPVTQESQGSWWALGSIWSRHQKPKMRQIQRRQGAGSHDLWMSFLACSLRFRAVFHELSLSHCLRADNSHCSDWGQDRSSRASFWRRRNIIP